MASMLDDDWQIVAVAVLSATLAAPARAGAASALYTRALARERTVRDAAHEPTLHADARASSRPTKRSSGASRPAATATTRSGRPATCRCSPTSGSATPPIAGRACGCSTQLKTQYPSSIAAGSLRRARRGVRRGPPPHRREVHVSRRDGIPRAPPAASRCVERSCGDDRPAASDAGSPRRIASRRRRVGGARRSDRGDPRRSRGRRCRTASA